MCNLCEIVFCSPLWREREKSYSGVTAGDVTSSQFKTSAVKVEYKKLEQCEKFIIRTDGSKTVKIVPPDDQAEARRTIQCRALNI